jgi:outer membrane protein assembly factor BamB
VCWRHDNQTFLRHRDSGRLLEIWIGGVLAATVQWDGLWRLRGTVTEGVTFYGALSDPVFYRSSEGRLYFGTGGGGSYMPRLALDSSGNLLVNGSVTEGFPRADIVLQSCIEAGAAHFAKGIEESLPVFVYDVAASTLQVRGTLAEKERFY